VTELLTRRAAALTTLALAAFAATGARAQKNAEQQEYEDRQKAYLVENLKKPGWKATASGVQYKRSGAAKPRGAQPTADSTISINYTGKTIGGTTFDESPEGEPMVTPLKELIRGLREVIPMMHAGETWDFVIPAEQGYGERGGRSRPPWSTLVFRIELVSVG